MFKRKRIALRMRKTSDSGLYFGIWLVVLSVLLFEMRSFGRSHDLRGAHARMWRNHPRLLTWRSRTRSPLSRVALMAKNATWRPVPRGLSLSFLFFGRRLMSSGLVASTTTPTWRISLWRGPNTGAKYVFFHVLLSIFLCVRQRTRQIR